MGRHVFSSGDLRDAVLGEIFAGCYENELDIQSFVCDLDAFAEGRAFKKMNHRTFLFYVDENFEKDFAKFMKEHTNGKIFCEEFWGRHIAQKMKRISPVTWDENGNVRTRSRTRGAGSA